MLDPFVEACGVAHVGREELATWQNGIKSAGVGVNRIAVGFEGVDFAVVAQEVERLGQGPVGIGIGAVAAVERAEP